jgi:hypothetical protein
MVRSEILVVNGGEDVNTDLIVHPFLARITFQRFLIFHRKLRRIPRLFRAGRNASRLTDRCSYFVLDSSG